MLGPLTISRDGVVQALPASRKVRALLAYLALAPRAVGRSHLCELLWDVPNDPRRAPLVPQQDSEASRRTRAPQGRSRGDAITLDVAAIASSMSSRLPARPRRESRRSSQAG